MSSFYHYCHYSPVLTSLFTNATPTPDTHHEERNTSRCFSVLLIMVIEVIAYLLNQMSRRKKCKQNCESFNVLWVSKSLLVK